MKTRRFALISCCCLFISLSTLISCAKKPVPTPDEVAVRWAKMTLFITRNTPANTPTYASRCLGYIGLTMYESVAAGDPAAGDSGPGAPAAGDPAHQSLGGQLNGLPALPRPEPGRTYDWVLSLNAGQAQILRLIYNQTSDANKHRIDSLESLIGDAWATRPAASDSTARRSVAFGRAIATQIFNWSKTDGGHRGYLKNFDKTMTHAVRPGGWQPPLYAQSFSHFPLHPHWGQNRTFLAQDAQLAPPAMIAYDTLPSSDYYRQYRQVYDQRQRLTQAQKETAIWWSDDPEETFTPPGHSYYLAMLAVQKKRPSLIVCAETFARVGMAVADAFIDCWKWKYQFFSERPNTFIPQHIDRQWESFWPDPPFPAFPSGHAMQAAAAATVLTDLYGPAFAFTDSAHAGRHRDELRNADFKPRRFRSFWQVAEETADSRFYGGIHTPQDNRAGLEKGRAIGQHINGLAWRKKG